MGAEGVSGSALADRWPLSPEVAYLNHGSFGSCPLAVLEVQRGLRDEMEREPMEFFVRRYFDRVDAVRERLAGFLGADPEGLVPVTNATSGVNAVLRSFPLERGDEVLVTDHAYNACRNALDFVAERAGARVVVVRIPFPGADPESVERSILDAATSRTRIALIDHITSPTGMVLPIEAIVRGLGQRSVPVLVDGAHAPGMVPLDLERLSAAFYTGNCHKWICAPKGAGFLVVAPEYRDVVKPLVISHGVNLRRQGRSRFHDEFDWPGTDDPTAWFSVPAALDFLGGLYEDGWPGLRRRNRELALAAREVLRGVLGIDVPCPGSMIGSLAALPLPGPAQRAEDSSLPFDPLQDRLLREHRIQAVVMLRSDPPQRLLRVSAQAYNRIEQYEALADALRDAL